MKQLVARVRIGDCDVQTFRAGGPGGQKQNKTDSGVRIIHRASGARGESREKRSQGENKRLAFERMARTVEFDRWARVQSGLVDEAVERSMQPWNIVIENFVPGTN